jgi:hypothetical protein
MVKKKNLTLGGRLNSINCYLIFSELEALNPTRKFNLVLVNVGKKELVSILTS